MKELVEDWAAEFRNPITGFHTASPFKNNKQVRQRNANKLLVHGKDRTGGESPEIFKDKETQSQSDR
jgi:hypothetical protein